MGWLDDFGSGCLTEWKVTCYCKALSRFQAQLLRRFSPMAIGWNLQFPVGCCLKVLVSCHVDLSTRLPGHPQDPAPGFPQSAAAEDRNHSLYNLISKVTYYCFCHTALVTQIKTSPVRERIPKGSLRPSCRFTATQTKLANKHKVTQWEAEPDVEFLSLDSKFLTSFLQLSRLTNIPFDSKEKEANEKLI